MNLSIEGVVTFLQDNDSLIKQLMETAESATTGIEQWPPKSTMREMRRKYWSISWAG